MAAFMAHVSCIYASVSQRIYDYCLKWGQVAQFTKALD